MEKGACNSLFVAVVLAGETLKTGSTDRRDIHKCEKLVRGVVLHLHQAVILLFANNIARMPDQFSCPGVVDTQQAAFAADRHPRTVGRSIGDIAFAFGHGVSDFAVEMRGQLGVVSLESGCLKIGADPFINPVAGLPGQNAADKSDVPTGCA